MSARRLLLMLLALAWSSNAAAAPQDRETKVRNDKKNVEADESWVYNDLERGIAEARSSGKPLLVVFRCIPCEACSEFDDQVVRRDPAVRDLMDQFVCVRIVQANHMDLAQFQFDYDQSFSAFLMNADKTIYGRFGTHSHHHDESQDMTMEGFGKALAAALALHKQYPANKELFVAKRGPRPKVRVPEEYPSLSGKYEATLNYEGNVVKSCLHCHQVREAERLVYRSQGQPIPDRVLFPYPLPSVVGLEMDSKHMARVADVAAGSAADRGGFEPGDDLLTLAGQPLLSIADVQWVLHNAADADKLPATVRRNGREVPLTLSLDSGWRKRQDISWRPTSWDLRRLATGGMVLEDLPSEDRQAQQLAGDKLALRVKGLGQYGEHATAKQAGFQKGDVLIEFDGQSNRLNETGFFAQILNHTSPGNRLDVTVLRDGKKLKLKLPVR